MYCFITVKALKDISLILPKTHKMHYENPDADIRMDELQKEFINILSCEAFKRFMSAGIKLSQLQTLMLLLIKFKIPFDLSFDPGNRRNEFSIELEIYITPHSSLTFTIGQEVFET